MKESTYKNPDFQGAETYALTRLAEELPSRLVYHNLFHTRDDVLAAVVRLGTLSGVDSVELSLLRVAAAFHDIGFIYTSQEHELIGARIAAQKLPEFGLKPRHIEKIMGMILATRLPQAPHNLLEEILADADLDVLGRKDFFDRNEALRQELAGNSHPIPLQQWCDSQLIFMRQHRYHTEAARQLRGMKKQANMEEMEERCSAL